MGKPQTGQMGATNANSLRDSPLLHLPRAFLAARLCGRFLPPCLARDIVAWLGLGHLKCRIFWQNLASTGNMDRRSLHLPAEGFSLRSWRISANLTDWVAFFQARCSHGSAWKCHDFYPNVQSRRLRPSLSPIISIIPSISFLPTDIRPRPFCAAC